MKSEKLQDAIGEIFDGYIEDAHGNHAVSGRKKYYMRWGVAAACVCFVAVMGLIVSNKNGSRPSGGSYISIADNSDKNKPDDNTGKGEVMDALKEPQTNKEDNSETYTQASVDVDSLLSAPAEKQKLFMREIPVGKYTAVYEMVDSVGSETLKNCRGEKLKKSDDAFYVLGHEDLEYVIVEEDDSNNEKEADSKASKKDKFSLWKFECFKSEKYPYKDVLELIYNVKDAKDIETVTVSPATMDNTDEGKKLQKEIGTSKITKRNDIKELYKILVSLECYGSDKWELIDYGEDYELLEAVRQGRYLTLNIRNGCRADRLKYTGVSGMFYEYAGIAYNRLKNKDNDKVKKILGIAG